MLLMLKYPKKILGPRHRLPGSRGCRWTGAVTGVRLPSVDKRMRAIPASPRLVRVPPTPNSRALYSFSGALRGALETARSPGGRNTVGAEAADDESRGPAGWSAGASGRRP